ncbi:CLUMA_CG015975, isoform A [Clunio marinus]|uniref:CLUMA_CG015975, isoform A n=1 Tax=Clunio marinus TaxID=568069 RepID=A0A1J1IRD8_9DIPT|nr:CLUMA_CG015975, isoform A [Clunio marinus]
MKTVCDKRLCQLPIVSLLLTLRKYSELSWRRKFVLPKSQQTLALLDRNFRKKTKIYPVTIPKDCIDQLVSQHFIVY